MTTLPPQVVLLTTAVALVVPVGLGRALLQARIGSRRRCHAAV